MNKYISLAELKVGEWGLVKRLDNEIGMKKRLLDVGLTENSPVQCVGVSPMGDPKAYRLCGAVMAIRKVDGAKVLVLRGRGGEG